MEASKGKTNCMFYVCLCLFILCVSVDKLKVDTRAEEVHLKGPFGAERGWAQPLTPFTVLAAKGEHGGQNPGGQTDIPVRYHILERWAQPLVILRLCYLLFGLHPQHLKPNSILPLKAWYPK